MQFDKEAVTLFLLKVVSYTVNTLIVLSVLAAVGFFVYYLFMGSTAQLKRKASIENHQRENRQGIILQRYA